ncbi:MAG TPA: GerMN domain-containing protein [Candidatus Acidoferrales bacterium]|nr:GerMN domain-containing protein [Candidatus Acidoferrales bacterium]
MNEPRSPWTVPALIVLVASVLFAGIYFFSLRNRMRELATTPQTDERARIELAQPTPAGAKSVPKLPARIFWLSATLPNSLEATTVTLPLASDPVQRAKQLIDELIAEPPTNPQRTLPADSSLLAFYILPDGTAIADFSDATSAGIPSGIQSEELAIDSIVQTLHAGIPQIRRVKILLHGQEADTLAGHLDLSGFFSTEGAGPAATPVQR